jgi:hypothetical protein
MNLAHDSNKNSRLPGDPRGRARAAFVLIGVGSISVFSGFGVASAVFRGANRLIDNVFYDPASQRLDCPSCSEESPASRLRMRRISDRRIASTWSFKDAMMGMTSTRSSDIGEKTSLSVLSST